MNKIHKSQYNESLGTWVAVPEIAKGRGKATGVAKEIPMTPSLPKFAISALTLALLQVVSVSAYASGGLQYNTGIQSENYSTNRCSMGDDSFSCGNNVSLFTSAKSSNSPGNPGVAVGSNVYANMSTAIGNNIVIGKEGVLETYNKAVEEAKKRVKEDGYDLSPGNVNQKLKQVVKEPEYNISSGDIGKSSVAFGQDITISTQNTVAIGNSIHDTKENSVFLGNNSGYISSDKTEEKDKKKSLGNAVAAATSVTNQPLLDEVRLSKNLSYAGVSNTIGVVSVGNSEGTRRIQGVAPGLVSENSADAINGAQLSAAYSKIEDNTNNIAGNTTKIEGNTNNIAGNTTKIENNTAKIEQGWDIAKVDKSAVTNEFKETKNANIKLGDTVNFADSDTVSVALKKDGDEKVAVQFNVDQNEIQKNSLNQLPVVYTDEAGNIVQRVGNKWYKTSEIEKVNGDYSKLSGGIDGNQILAASLHNPVAKDGKRGASFTLTNLADGDISENSKDAINGSQLHSVKEEIAQGWNIGKVDVSALNGLDDITDKKIALGDSVKFAAADGVSVALKKVNDKTVAVQIGLNKGKVHADTVTQLPVVYTDGDGNIVQRGKDGLWYKSSEIANVNGDYTGLTGIGDNDIIAAIHNPVGTAGKNISGNPFKLTNLDEGSVSAESKDAINGSQLFSDRVALAGLLGGGAAALTPDKKEGFTLNADGKKVPVKTLDGLMLDGDFQAPTFTVNKANGDVYQIGSGADAKDAVAHNVGDALENLNTYVNEGITVADNNGHSGSLAPTETLKFANGNKTTAKVSKQGNTVTVTVDVDSEAIASDVLTQGPVIYTVKNGSENAPVVKIDNKWYLAKDVTNGEPVAGAQEQAADSINASLRNPNAGATSAGAAYVLNNIADGVAPHDAINKRQFDYAVVYGDSSSPNYAEAADHSFVAFKGTPVEVLGNGTTKLDTGTQLQNVASAGDINLASNAGHAVNAGDLKYQVDSLTNSLTEKGLYFAGDSDDSVHKNLGETLKVTGDDNIKVAASNGGLQVSIIDNPTFAGTVTANGGIVAGDKNSISINTDGDGKIHGLTNVDIEKDGKSVLDNGDNGKSVAATEAQLSKVIAKINSNDKNINDRIDEGRVFTGDIGDQVKVGLGDALAVNGGIDDESKLSEGNIGVVTKESGLEIKLGKELNGINSITLTAPDPNRDSGGNGGNGTPSPTTDLNNNGIRIKPSVVNGAEVALTDAGLDNGGNKIVNVGPGDIGSDSTDAINGSQLQDQIDAVKKIIGGSVEYNYSSNEYVVKNPERDGNGNPSGGIGGTGQITIDAAIKSIKDQKETAYTPGKNIDITPDPDKPGTKIIRTADNVEFNSVKIIGNNPDKSVEINENGINAGNMKVRNVAAGRIAPSSQDAVNGSQLYQVKQDINEMDKRARSGIASAMASAGLPQAYLPGKSMVGAAASNYRGETAIAVGVSTISDNGKWLVKADANANRHDFGVSLGVGYQW